MCILVGGLLLPFLFLALFNQKFSFSFQCFVFKRGHFRHFIPLLDLCKQLFQMFQQHVIVFALNSIRIVFIGLKKNVSQMSTYRVFQKLCQMFVVFLTERQNAVYFKMCLPEFRMKKQLQLCRHVIANSTTLHSFLTQTAAIYWRCLWCVSSHCFDAIFTKNMITRQ